MKSIKYILYIWLISIGASSCNFLDKEPTHLSPETYFKNESQAFSSLAYMLYYNKRHTMETAGFIWLEEMIYLIMEVNVDQANQD